MTHVSADGPWARARLALTLLAVDPAGLGGLWLRARSGPVRDKFMALMEGIPIRGRRVHPDITDEQLFGGLDLSATLAEGRSVRSRGILAEDGLLVLTMAERCRPGLAGRLGQVLDGASHALVALDEGAEADETLPQALAERLAFFAPLDGLALADIDDCVPDPNVMTEARGRLADVRLPPDAAERIVTLAAACGIASLRAPLLAMAAARAHSALFGRISVDSCDIEAACTLVYAHRATVLPEAAPEAEPPPPPPEAQGDAPERDDDTPAPQSLPDEVLLDAIRTALPAGLLAHLAAGRAARGRAAAAGSGAAHKGNRRGRPLPSRPGRLDGRSRIDLVATLRAAAPWQPMRRAASPRGHLLHIRPSDIRLRRFQETSDRLLIFTVDASGSAAMARLGEAKGAVELLLAEAYARRDHVALIAFRGEGAELLLPPTRSLVQTKRRLAGLPGGGGTPLAAGLKSAFDLARQAAARGMTPTLALLTDGRANIALDGAANRAQAAEDATRLARAFPASGMPTLVIDTANRPQEPLRALAGVLNGPYIALPRADAHRLSSAVAAALGD